MYNVYIDDTSISGNPCEVYSVNSNYKSYIAIFLENNAAMAAKRVMLKLTEDLKNQYGTDEFHFTDIYSRHGPYKTMSQDEKEGLFETFSDLINHFGIHWTIQSMTYESKRKIDDAIKKAKTENNSNLPDIAELMLLMKKLNGLIQNQIIPSKNIHIVCDSGIKKPGESLTFPDSGKIFVFPPIIYFEDSKKEPLLQLADFVAFCFLRNQIGIKKFLEDRSSDPPSFYYKIQEITSEVMANCVSPDVVLKEIDDDDSLESINSEAKNLLQKKKD